MSENIETINIGPVDWEKTANLAWDGIKRVRELHIPKPCWCCEDVLCANCNETYPCSTKRALDGEQKITQEEQRQALREIRQMEVELGMLDGEQE